jgi:hypothetical protein
MSDRLRCCVPFCRRTHKPGQWAEWMCQKHWVLIRAERRRVYRRLERRWHRYRDETLLERGHRLWSVIRREAIERAAGL